MGKAAGLCIFAIVFIWGGKARGQRKVKLEADLQVKFDFDLLI